MSEEMQCGVMTRQCPPLVRVGAVLIHNLNGAQWDITSLHHWGSSHSAMGGLNNNNIDIDLPALLQLSSSSALQEIKHPQTAGLKVPARA